MGWRTSESLSGLYLAKSPQCGLDPRKYMRSGRCGCAILLKVRGGSIWALLQQQVRPFYVWSSVVTVEVERRMEARTQE